MIKENLQIETMRLEQFFNVFEDCILCAQEYKACDSESKKHTVIQDSTIYTQSVFAHTIADATEDRCLIIKLQQ